MKNLGREPEIVRLMCRMLAGAITVLAPLNLPVNFQGTGVRLGGHRSTCFIRTAQHALIPKTFAESVGEKEALICATLLPSVARVSLPL